MKPFEVFVFLNVLFRVEAITGHGNAIFQTKSPTDRVRLLLCLLKNKDCDRKRDIKVRNADIDNIKDDKKNDVNDAKYATSRDNNANLFDDKNSSARQDKAKTDDVKNNFAVRRNILNSDGVETSRHRIYWEETVQYKIVQWTKVIRMIDQILDR